MNRLIALIFILAMSNAYADSRIKDIVYFEGIRENILVGYGLVVGLNGTGDDLKNSDFTEKGLTNFLEKLGINSRGAKLKTKNIAAVMVTANLPAFARTGSRINVDVSAIGDAKSIKGGTLLATPLYGADGEVYALTQGLISIGNKPADDPTKPPTNTPTSGYISGGAIIEREVDFKLNDLSELNLALKNPDLSTARAIETAINSSMRKVVASANDPGTVKIKVPQEYKSNIVGLLADIEGLSVYPDSVAKVVIDEASGTIVIGENVRITNVAVAQGNVIVKVNDQDQFAFDVGVTQNKPAPSKPGEEIAIIKEPTRLSDLVEGLNALGVKPKDLSAILKTIKAAGAMHAEIETR